MIGAAPGVVGGLSQSLLLNSRKAHTSRLNCLSSFGISKPWTLFHSSPGEVTAPK